MGTAKLLMPWGDGTVLDLVLAAWKVSRATATVVVTHPDDDAIFEIVQRHQAHAVVAASPPPDMKASVLIGLSYVRERFRPQSSDWWLLAPADMPKLSTEVIDEVILAAVAADEPIVVPTFSGARGHPVAFRWCLAEEVGQLDDHQGVNALLERHAVRSVEVLHEAILDDLDTPEDYRVRYSREHSANS
jgi:CTP:molybdopterin cytidylyltransferase MocA